MAGTYFNGRYQVQGQRLHLGISRRDHLLSISTRLWLTKMCFEADFSNLKDFHVRASISNNNNVYLGFAPNLPKSEEGHLRVRLSTAILHIMRSLLEGLLAKM